MTNQIEDFMIKWHNVRKELSSLACYRAQVRLKTWISSHHIRSSVVEQEMKAQRAALSEYTEALDLLQRQYDILCYVKKLDRGEEGREKAILSLMDYGLDAECDEEIQPYRAMDVKSVKNEKNRIESKLRALENKMKKFEQFLPELVDLEIQEVVLAYRPYTNLGVYKKETIAMIISSCSIYDKVLYPKEFEKVYALMENGHKCLMDEAAITVSE